MKTLRSKFLVTLIATLFLCLSLAIAFAFNNQKAYADVDNDTFAMAEGAEIALNKDGLRFRVQMGQNVYDRIYTNDTEDNVKLSVLIAPKSYFDALNATANAGEYQLLSKKIEVEIDNQQKVYQKDGYYFANAVLTNLAMENNDKITKDQFDFDFVAVGCIATTDGETTSYEYASFFDGDMANNVRSQYELAQAAVLFEDDEDLAIASDVLAEEGPYGSWIGSENYPINVDEADEYSILQAKVAAGLVTNAKFNVYNKFGLESKENLPANTTLYHYVNFYNNDQVLQTLEVKEGDTAEFPANAELPKFADLIAEGSGYVRGYRNTGWVNKADDSEVSLSTITNNVDVKIKWTHDQQQTYLLEDLHNNEPNTVLSFDTELGLCQLKSDNDSPWDSRSYNTEIKLDGQRGTTKINWTGEYSDLYFGYFTNVQVPGDGYNEKFDYSQYDDNSYMVMDIYAEFPEDIDRIYVRIRYSAHGSIKNNSWGRIVVPMANLLAARENGEWFNVNPVDANGDLVESSGAIYMAKAYMVTGDEIKTIAGEDSFNIGSMAMAGAYFYNQTISRTDIFTNAYYNTIQLVDGQLFYTSSNLTEDRGAYLVFAQPQTGTLYFTARGIDATSDAQRFDESGAHVYTPNFEYVGDAGDGYSVYSLDLAQYSIKKIKLRTYNNRNNQVWIKDISTTNPLA